MAINERKRQQFWDMQSFVKKKIKGAHTKVNDDGKIYVADRNGRNTIGTKYPSLALAPDGIVTIKVMLKYYQRI